MLACVNSYECHIQQVVSRQPHNPRPDRTAILIPPRTPHIMLKVVKKKAVIPSHPSSRCSPEWFECYHSCPYDHTSFNSCAHAATCTHSTEFIFVKQPHLLLEKLIQSYYVTLCLQKQFVQAITRRINYLKTLLMTATHSGLN